MKEFGSDFHYFEDFFSNRASLNRVFSSAAYYAFGRHPIIALIVYCGWKRIWMPAYFCYEVIDSIRKTGISICFYKDYPGENDEASIAGIPFEEGDVLFRVDYFGTRNLRDNKGLLVPVIEDHSHDLLGHWSLFSNADWCIASLRKSLPLAEGGMLWSPKGYALPAISKSSTNNNLLAEERWEGMVMKTSYLGNKDVDKCQFRQKYLHSEDMIDDIEPCAIAGRDLDYIKKLDINLWYNAKKQNWAYLNREVKQTYFYIIQPQCIASTPFSLVLMANSKEERNTLRKHLIANAVYPAILWPYEGEGCERAKDLSERILSIHCDGRYSLDDMAQLAAIINNCEY